KIGIKCSLSKRRPQVLKNEANGKVQQPAVPRVRLSSRSSDYIVEDLVGNGAFAKVAKCVKSATKEMVALRVVKIHTKSDLQREHEILLKLRYFNPDECNFVKWHCSFMYKRHLCQEFELLDMSLREFVTMRPTRSLHLKEIQTILYQLATTLEVLKRLQVAHCDLKLENIMLVDHVRQPLRVKVIDFGSACNASNIAHGAYIQTRWYRAPETILGLPCSEAIDMWSLGCIAAELFLGHPLYPGSCEYQMRQFMIQTQGQLPGYFLSAGLKRSLFYWRTWKYVDLQETTRVWRYSISI
uniref:Protein kinase domain-containing protein n=1 Tax=Labrus bergylta TaxID=56723 RepID=A0A3Q3EAP6_9LABR